jgi:putative transposase
MIAWGNAPGDVITWSHEPQRGGTKEPIVAQSLSNVVLHIVFSTKGRGTWLKDSEIRQELYSYLATILKRIECPAIIINGVEDHLHILCLLSRKLAIKDLMEEIKSSSSRWIKDKGINYRGFYWQRGYAVFSVSESKVPEVKRYIANQEVHHRRMSFQDEFRAMCQRHGIDIDEKYVWD